MKTIVNKILKLSLMLCLILTVSEAFGQLANGPNIVRMDDGTIFGIYVTEHWFWGTKTYTIYCPTVKTDRRGDYIDWTSHSSGHLLEGGGLGGAGGIQFGSYTAKPTGANIFKVSGMNLLNTAIGNGAISHGGGGLKPSEIDPAKPCPPPL